jgi:hypothetical protein
MFVHISELGAAAAAQKSERHAESEAAASPATSAEAVTEGENRKGTHSMRQEALCAAQVPAYRPLGPECSLLARKFPAESAGHVLNVLGKCSSPLRILNEGVGEADTSVGTMSRLRRLNHNNEATSTP